MENLDIWLPNISLAEENIILLYIEPFLRAVWRTLLAWAYQLK